MKFSGRNIYNRWLLALVCIAVVIAGFFVPAGEGESGLWWSHVYGFFALLGFIGCAAIVIIAKWLGHYWLQRKDDYYD
jgi:hypothetical protein